MEYLEETLKNELLEKKNAIETASQKLGKANLILGNWVDTYGFAEDPDPRTAIEFGRKESDVHMIQSATWFHEYESIYNLVDIAWDYVREGMKILEDAMKK